MNPVRVVVCALCMGHSLRAGAVEAVRINEFMASNLHVQLNPEYSDFPDWIELYNSGDTPLDPGRLFLTDDFETPFKWRLPGGTVLEPGAFFIVWADGLGLGPHASFKLNGSGGQIGLFRQDGSVLDTVTYGRQLDDVSQGRFPDGGDSLYYFSEPTFNRPNSAIGTVPCFQASQPDFLPVGGLYSGGQTVTLTADPGTSVRYTTDGSLPTPQSALYTHPLSLQATTALRARAFGNDRLPSRTATHTYVIREPSTLPVISLTTPPEFVFDPIIGITAGVCVADSVGAPPPFDPNANFWKDWERPVHVEFYEPDGRPGFRQDAGLAVFGGFFGRQIRQKAFTLFARGKYGDEDFDYPLFPDKSIGSFKRLVLRCSSNDFNSTYLRDAMMNKLVIGQMDVDYQAYQPAVVYLNGVFWGLYNIREKTNEYYPESNYQVDVDDVDLVQGIDSTVHGDGSAYRNLLQYVKDHDLAVPADYQVVETQMDAGEFMNYLITEIYVCNHDWLHQNIKCWRAHGAGGRWRWLLYDMDWGFGGRDVREPEPYATHTLQWIFEQGESSLLIRRCLSNPDFRDEFAQRFATHLSLTFRPDRVVRILDGMARRIAPEMPRQIERWGAIPSLAYWNGQLDRLREFAHERPRRVFEHLEQTLDLDGKTDLTFDVSDSAAGWISVNEVPAEPPSVTGTWFRNIPLRIEAHPRAGWRFARWEGAASSGSGRLLLTPADPARLRAVFEPSGLPSLAISEIHYHPSASPRGGEEAHEFVEIVNLGAGEADVSGYCFSMGFSFAFPPGSRMAPGERVVVAKNAETYRGRGFQVFQMEEGKLNNAGEVLCLCRPDGSVADSVRYDDQPPWVTDPDGGGPSLELKDPRLDNNTASAWRASETTGGTPGEPTPTGVSDRNPAGPIPTACGLGQNYPNPFNPSTTVRFTLPADRRVTIKVYNTMGEEVAVLVDAALKAGAHRAEWNAAGFGSGVYFCRMRAGDFTATRKLLLMK